MVNVLVCDDEKDIVSALRIYLESEGYQVYTAYDGLEALEVLETKEIHLVLLDVMMPRLDGIQTMAKIRETSNVPIILLTAKSEDTDKVLGLNVGADDYVTKPFNPVELQARVKSQLRRYMQLGGNHASTSGDDGIIAIGPIVLNDRAKEVTLDGELVNLTRTEYDILHLLMENPGKVFSRHKSMNRSGRKMPLAQKIPLLSISVICVKNWSMIRQNQGMLRLCGEEGTRLKTNRARPYKLPR